MLTCGRPLKHQHRHTHLSTWIFTSKNIWQTEAAVVGLCASCLPQAPPLVNPCDYVNSTNVYSCARVGLVLDLGRPCVWHGEGEMTCVYYCCTLSGTKKVQIEKKRGWLLVLFLVLNQCVTQGAAISCKLCHNSCISSYYLRYFCTYLLLGYWHLIKNVV